MNFQNFLIILAFYAIVTASTSAEETEDNDGEFEDYEEIISGGVFQNRGARHLVEVDKGVGHVSTTITGGAHGSAVIPGGSTSTSTSHSIGGSEGQGESSSSSTISTSSVGPSSHGHIVIPDLSGNPTHESTTGGGGTSGVLKKDEKTESTVAGGANETKEAGFLADLQQMIIDHLPFVIVGAILVVTSVIVCVCGIKIIRAFRQQQPGVSNVSEEFKKMKDSDLNKDLENPHDDDSIRFKPLNEHQQPQPQDVSKRTTTPTYFKKSDDNPEAKPVVRFSDSDPRSAREDSPELVSDDRLRQIEKEIRDLELSMNSGSRTPGLASSDVSYSKELEYLSTKPDQLKNLENLSNRPDQLRDMENIVRRPEELRRTENITSKPEQLKNLEKLVDSDHAEQISQIHIIVQHPQELEQISALVQKPKQLNNMTYCAKRPKDLQMVENKIRNTPRLREVEKSGTGDRDESEAETLSPYQRQLSEKSEAIAKLDGILEEFNEMEEREKEKRKKVPHIDERDGDEENLTEIARKHTRVSSGPVTPSHGEVGVVPVPGFTRPMEPPVSRTKPTISLYSTASGKPYATKSAQLPPTTRRLLAAPPSMAFGSKVSTGPPAPLKARSGLTASGGRALVLAESDLGSQSSINSARRLHYMNLPPIIDT